MDIDFNKLNKLTHKNSILIGYRGSISHGMYVPNSDPNSIDDVDLMGVFIASKSHYLGFNNDECSEKFVDEYDVVNYELRKFMRLLLKSNPNVLSLLWLPSHYIKYITPLGGKLIDHREVFVSKFAYKSFCGYGLGQLKKMTKYSYEGYMGTKRKEIVKKYGYDVKNASHCIRILRMGIEFLNEGKLFVDRTDIDAKELLDIKKGKWSFDKVNRVAESHIPRLKEAFINSNLPDKPDKESAEKLLMDIISEYHQIKFT